MTEKIIIAGSGGQGVLTLGVFIAKIGFFENKNVTWLPSYGAEKRGGFSFCNTVISDEEIYSPVVEIPDTLILFDRRAYEIYKNKIKENTVVILNTSLVGDIKEKGKNFYLIPALNIAKEINFLQAMNIVIFGAYHFIKKIFKKESIIDVMREMLKDKKKEIFEKNKLAFEKGMEFIKENAI